MATPILPNETPAAVRGGNTVAQRDSEGCTEGGSMSCVTRSPLSAFRPLAAMPDERVAKMLRDAGMHAPVAEARQGNDALMIRRDVTMDDVAESAEAALTGAIGVLRYLVTDDAIHPVAYAATSSVLMTCELLAGHLAVIREGIGRAEVAA